MVQCRRTYMWLSTSVHGFTVSTRFHVVQSDSSPLLKSSAWLLFLHLPTRCRSGAVLLLPVFQDQSLTQTVALLNLDHPGCEDVMSDNSRDPEADERKEKAVVVVQRAWRAYALKKQYLDANARWKDAYLTARKRVSLGECLEYK